MMHFSDFPLSASLIKALEQRHIVVPSAVQEKVIPPALERKSIFFESETGTGKTLAFLLPLLTRSVCSAEKISLPRLLILSPTVELAAQIKETVAQLQVSGGDTFKSLLCVGGSSLKRQIEGLKEKPAIIIGTPARVADLIGLKKLKLHDIQAAVIDEADRQLAPESSDILRSVLTALPAGVQLLACSATLNRKSCATLAEYAGKTGDTQPLFIALPRERILQESIEHWAFFSERKNKTGTLRALLFALKGAKTLIFTAPAHEVETLAQKLQYKKMNAAPLYGKLQGADRKRIIAGFRSGKTPVLITSDLSARGLDIPDINYIVQMNLSKDAASFIHRAGRTGRAGKRGVNIVIGDEYELRILQRLEKKLGITVQPKVLFEGRIEEPPPME